MLYGGISLISVLNGSNLTLLHYLCIKSSDIRQYSRVSRHSNLARFCFPEATEDVEPLMEYSEVSKDDGSGGVAMAIRFRDQLRYLKVISQ